MYENATTVESPFSMRRHFYQTCVVPVSACIAFAALSCSSEDERPLDSVTNRSQGGSETGDAASQNRPGGAGGAGGAPASVGQSGMASGEEAMGGLGLDAMSGAGPGPSSSGSGDGPDAGSAATPDASGEPAPEAPDTTADGTMTFFVTSRGGTQGGNLGGLAGADGLCRELAVAASADFARRQWRAYLSTSTAAARERIGTGPWHNQAGDLIANDLAQLHDQAAGGSLDATWPVNDFGVPLDEQGNQVAQNVHDVLTGSEQDGSLAQGLTCNDWTSNATNVQGRIGHTNRAGLMGQPPSWNAVHAVGCGPAGANFGEGTVTQGGGRGSIYCFAVIDDD